MLRIFVDFNRRELYPDGNQAVAIPLHLPDAAEFKRLLSVGQVITVYDSDMEWQATLRRGARYDWVADLLEGTVRDYPL